MAILVSSLWVLKIFSEMPWASEFYLDGFQRLAAMTCTSTSKEIQEILLHHVFADFAMQ